MKKTLLIIAFIGLSLTHVSPTKADVSTATKIMIGAIGTALVCEAVYQVWPVVRTAIQQIYKSCKACAERPWRLAAAAVTVACLCHIGDELAKKEGITIILDTTK